MNHWPIEEAPGRLWHVPAPAKLNLFLHVTGRRPDGYHLIQSAFMLIDWCDTLDFERRTDGRICREDVKDADTPEDIPLLPEHDLVVRAALALQAATGCAQGATIRLHKRLPMEAGLGGGSSDAATCLLALNRLWGLRLSRPALQTIGLGLGADVPFFLSGGHAWVEGIGEHLQPLALPQGRFVVLKPAAGVPTAAIFSSPELKRDTVTATMAGFVAQLLDGHWDFGGNDLQNVATALCPDVGLALKQLSAWGLKGRMTGSGSAVFAPVDTAWGMPIVPPGWIGRICNNMDAHPLRDWCPD